MYSDHAAKGKDAGEKISASKSNPWVSVRNFQSEKSAIAHYYMQVVGVTVVQAGIHI